jgi:type IV pilus assembly protein PilF
VSSRRVRPTGRVRPGILAFAIACAAILPGCASSGGGKGAAQGESERYLRLGYVQLERGQTQEALASAQTAIDRDPKNADAHNFLGLIYMSQSDYPKAAERLKEAVKINPFFTDAHNNLGVAYRQLKQYDKALGEFQTALKDKTYKTPEKIELNLGHLYLDQGVLSEAVNAYERAIGINPNYALGHLALGTAYRKMGREDLAGKQFQKVIQLAPDTPEATRAKQELASGAGRSGS